MRTGSRPVRTVDGRLAGMIPVPAPLRLVQDEPAATTATDAPSATVISSTAPAAQPAPLAASASSHGAVVQPPTDGSSIAKIAPPEPTPAPASSVTQAIAP